MNFRSRTESTALFSLPVEATPGLVRPTPADSGRHNLTTFPIRYWLFDDLVVLVVHGRWYMCFLPPIGRTMDDRCMVVDIVDIHRGVDCVVDEDVVILLNSTDRGYRRDNRSIMNSFRTEVLDQLT